MKECATIVTKHIGSFDGTLNKRKIASYRKRLRCDSDPDNRDYRIKAFMTQLVRPQYLGRLKRADIYLSSLRSEDGHRFSRSRKEFVKLRENLESFKRADHPNFGWNENYQKAVKELSDKYRGTLTQLHYHDNESMEKVLPKKSTHTGFTFLFGENERTKGENLEDIYNRYCKYEAECRERNCAWRPMMVGVRTQAMGEYDENGKETGTFKQKTRGIYMSDLFQVFLHLKWSIPVQNLVNLNWDGYAGGKNDPAIASFMANNCVMSTQWWSIDYSKYDQSIASWMMKDAFRIMRSWFKDEGFEQDLWDLMVDGCINKVIIGPDDDFISTSGLTSGIMFTQLIGSICNWLMARTYIISKGCGSDKRCKTMSMSDDIIFITNKSGNLSLEEYASYIKHNFGVTINTDKTTVGSGYFDDPHFLSRRWSKLGPTRPFEEVVSRMLYPERYRNYKARDPEKRCKVHEVFFSYYLAYEPIMRECFDMNRFFDMYPYLRGCKLEDMKEMASRYLSGYIAYKLNYELT